MFVRTAARFADAARRYCHIVETADQYDLLPRLTAFSSALCDVYAAALELPLVEPAEDDEVVPPATPCSTGRRTEFDRFEVIRQVFDPYEREEPLTSTLSDHVQDIYGDLKRGLQAYDLGRPEYIEHAVWEWRLHFLCHWGHHAVEALAAMYHAIVTLRGAEDDEEED